MKNKKGFTLAELLGVIVIISIILLLVMIPMTKNIQKGKDTVYENQLKVIELASENWSIDNSNTLPQKEGEKVTITVGTLKQEGYLEMDVKDPITGECIPNNTEITITKTENGYDIYVDVDSGTDECPDIDSNTPIIYLNGEALMYVEYGSTWIDPGATAKTSKGVPITNIDKKITGDGTSINTNGFNTYEIIYSASDKGITVSTRRTVIVHDTTPPVLNVPTNTTIPSTQTSFNALDGVTATDNADGNITNKIKVIGSVSTGVLGEYILTYEVTDNSGNKSVKTRKVIVQDKSAPTASATVQGNPFNGNGWAKANFQVRIDIKDTGGSGVAGFKYCETTSTTCTPNTNVSKTFDYMTIDTQSSTNYICVIPYDHAGNEGTRQCFGPYKLDKTKPSISYTNNKTIYQSAGSFNVYSDVTLSDNLTPANSITISNTSNLNFATPGTYTINYTFTDLAGNTNTSTRTIKIVDDVKPSLTVSKGCATAGNNGWCRGNVTGTISPSDNSTGIAERQYKIGNGSWTTFTGNTQTNTSDGTYTVYYRVKDGAGNWSNEVSISVSKDSTSPTCTSTAAGATAGNNGWWRSGITVTGNCSDSTSQCTGNSSVWYGTETNGTDVNPGVVYDKAGNSASCPNYYTKIDWTAPNITEAGGYWDTGQARYRGYLYVIDTGSGREYVHVTYRHCYKNYSGGLDANGNWTGSGCENFHLRSFTPLQVPWGGGATDENGQLYGYLMYQMKSGNVQVEFHVEDNAGNSTNLVKNWQW